MLAQLSDKFSARIAALPSGTSASLSATLADYNAKIADAKVQANAAVSEVANLKPDNGDTSIQQSNTAALKDARSKTQAAQQDIVAARKDAETIVKGLRGTGASVSGSASATTTTP
jgi:hypothetical protein